MRLGVRLVMLTDSAHSLGHRAIDRLSPRP